MSARHYGVKLVFQHDNHDAHEKWEGYEDFDYVYEEMIFVVPAANSKELAARIEEITDDYVDEDTVYTGYQSYSQLESARHLSEDFDYTDEVFFELTPSNLEVEEYLDRKYPDDERLID